MRARQPKPNPNPNPCTIKSLALALRLRAGGENKCVVPAKMLVGDTKFHLHTVLMGMRVMEKRGWVLIRNPDRPAIALEYTLTDRFPVPKSIFTGRLRLIRKVYSWPLKPTQTLVLVVIACNVDIPINEGVVDYPTLMHDTDLSKAAVQSVIAKVEKLRRLWREYRDRAPNRYGLPLGNDDFVTKEPKRVIKTKDALLKEIRNTYARNGGRPVRHSHRGLAKILRRSSKSVETAQAQLRKEGLLNWTPETDILGRATGTLYTPTPAPRRASHTTQREKPFSSRPKRPRGRPIQLSEKDQIKEEKAAKDCNGDTEKFAELLGLHSRYQRDEKFRSTLRQKKRRLLKRASERIT